MHPRKLTHLRRWLIAGVAGSALAFAVACEEPRDEPPPGEPPGAPGAPADPEPTEPTGPGDPPAPGAWLHFVDGEADV